MKLKATLIVEVDDEAVRCLGLDELREATESAVMLDIDNENGGIVSSLSVDWNTLTPAVD